MHPEDEACKQSTPAYLDNDPWRGLSAPDPAPATGRNQPCPCGSGLKYKRCCRSKPREVNPTPTATEVNSQ